MKVQKILDEKGIWYRIIEMSVPAKSSDIAEKQVSGDMDDIVKTIIMKVGDEFKAFCVRKDNLVDYNKLRKHFSVKKIRMANPDEVLKHSNSVPGGCCPLLVDVQVFIEPSILSLEKIHLGSGSVMHGLEMKTEDLIRLVNPKVLDMSVEK